MFHSTFHTLAGTVPRVPTCGGGSLSNRLWNAAARNLRPGGGWRVATLLTAMLLSVAPLSDQISTELEAPTATSSCGRPREGAQLRQDTGAAALAILLHS